VTHESEDWFYGHSPTNAEHAGVVPKSFVYLHKEIHSKQQSPIVEEATAALREWNGIFKEKYIEGVIKKESVGVRKYDSVNFLTLYVGQQFQAHKRYHEGCNVDEIINRFWQNDRG